MSYYRYDDTTAHRRDQFVDGCPLVIKARCHDTGNYAIDREGRWSGHIESFNGGRAFRVFSASGELMKGFSTLRESRAWVFNNHDRFKVEPSIVSSHTVSSSASDGKDFVGGFILGAVAGAIAASVLVTFIVL